MGQTARRTELFKVLALFKLQYNNVVSRMYLFQEIVALLLVVNGMSHGEGIVSGDGDISTGGSFGI